MSSDGPSCEVEAHLFSRYLLGSPATPVLVERYTRACGTLFTDTPAADTRLLRLAGQFPWLLGPIDWIFIFGDKHQRLGDKLAGTIVVPD